MHPSYFGCRQPIEHFNGLSCKGCYRHSGFGDDNCTYFSGDFKHNWYHTQTMCKYGPDPERTPKCASCFSRDENELMSLNQPLNCEYKNCHSVTIGGDPCYNPTSCECFCRNALYLLKICPAAKPKWLLE